jgi:hypothetical protein
MLLLVGCGGDDATSGPPLEVATSFTVTSVSGAGTSPLDPLAAQTIDFDIVWDAVDYNAGEGNDPPGCKTRLFGFAPTAKTSQSALVQSQVIDRLDGWSVRLQLCDSGPSTLAVDSAINELNLNFGCGGIPTTAVRKDATGAPVLTTFTATNCFATILDVVNNRVVQSSGFAVTITTGRGELP